MHSYHNPIILVDGSPRGRGGGTVPRTGPVSPPDLAVFPVRPASKSRPPSATFPAAARRCSTTVRSHSRWRAPPSRSALPLPSVPSVPERWPDRPAQPASSVPAPSPASSPFPGLTPLRDPGWKEHVGPRCSSPRRLPGHSLLFRAERGDSGRPSRTTQPP